MPTFVMIVTYTQYTQMPIILSTSFSIQTDKQTVKNTSTQTNTFQSTRATQMSSQNSKAVQTDYMHQIGERYQPVGPFKNKITSNKYYYELERKSVSICGKWLRAISFWKQ